MSFTGLQNTFVPLSINGLSQTFSSETDVGDITCNSISIQGIKNPLLNFPVSQDNITRFNGVYKLQYTDETVTVFTATNASITFGVALDIGNNNISTTGSISATTFNGTTVNGTTVNGTDLVANTLSIKNSGISTNKYLFDHDEKNNNLNLNFLTSSTNDKIFSIDQYGNAFFEQGIYFNGSVPHYIGNIGVSDIIFSIQSARKYSFLVNNIETASINGSGINTSGNLAFSGVVDHYISNNNGTDLYLTVTSGTSIKFQVDSITRAFINTFGFNTTGFLALNDSATGNSWTLFTASNLRLTIALNSGLIAYFDSNGLYSNTNIQTTIPTVYNVTSVGYLSVSQLVVTITSYPFIVGNQIMIQENPEYNGIFTVQTIVSGNVFYVNNPGFSNNGTQTQGKASLYSGIVSSFYNNAKQLIVDSDWIIRKTSLGYLYFTYAGFTKISMEGVTGIISTNSLNFTGNINSISSTVFNYLSGATSNIQTQINSINTSISNVLIKNAVNTGVNATFRLTTGGSLIVQNQTTGVAFQIDDVDSQTYIYHLKGTSLINGYLASYYDVSSSIQTQLNSKINLSGSTLNCNPTLQLSSGGAFTINSSVPATLFGVNGSTGITGVFKFNVADTSSFQALATFNAGISTTDITASGNLNSIPISRYDPTSSIQTQLNNRIPTSGTTAVNTNCIISSNNLILNNTIGQVDAYGLQLRQDTTVPNGFGAEFASGELLINTQINFRGTNAGIVTARRGIAFRLDNRVGIQPFQWYIRLAGSGVETLLMSLYDNGSLNCSSTTTSTGVYTPLIDRSDNAELIVRTGLSDSAPAGSYITMRTAATSLGVNFVNWNNTVNWAYIRSTNAGFSVPITSNSTLTVNGTTNINGDLYAGGAGIPSKLYPYVYSTNSNGNKMYFGESTSFCIKENGVAWGTGATYTDCFRKNVAFSCLSFVGTLTCYSSSISVIQILIRFTNNDTGTVYNTYHNFFPNLTNVHTTVGVSGIVSNSFDIGGGTPAEAGLYTVFIQRTTAHLQTDTNDQINIMFYINNSVRGLI
jgi:hypothetical protein